MCDRPAEITNGWHNGTSSYNESLKGVPVGTTVQYICKSGNKMLGKKNIKCMKGGVYFPPTPRCFNCKFELFLIITRVSYLFF